MSKKTKQIKPLHNSSTSVVALPFLAALQFSACIAKQSQSLGLGVDLVPMKAELNKCERLSKEGSKNSRARALQDAFVKAIRSDNYRCFQELLKNPSINYNDGGVFISNVQFDIATKRWEINNEQIKQAKYGRKVPLNLSKEEISEPRLDEMNYITMPRLHSFSDFSPNAEGFRVSSLVLAAKCKHEAVFLALIDLKNIDIVTPDPESGFSLLNLVVKNKWAAEAEYLVSHLNQEALLTQCKDDRGTPLHFALQLKLHRSLVQRLINRLPKEFLARLDEQQNTPLHLAMKYRSSDIVSALVSKIDVKDLSARDKEQNTPLHLAMKYRSSDVVSALVSKMDVKDLSAQDKDGKDALQLAIERGRLVAMQKLLPKLPADAVAKGLRFAFECYDNPKLLAPYKQYVDPRLMFKNRTKEIVKLLLTKGNNTPESLDVKEKNTQQDVEKTTLFHLAIQHGDITAAKLLRNKLPNSAVSFRYKDHEGKTALHLSIPGECKDITKFLIDNVPAEQLLSADNAGNTPLSLALLYKKEEAFDQIVSRIDANKLIEACFTKNKNGHSLFASAFLPKANQLSKLIHNRHVVMPSLFLPGYQIFKHIIASIGSDLTQEECMAIVNEIDDILSKRIISKTYACSLRCLLAPYIKDKAQVSGLTISRYDSYANKKAEVAYPINDQKDSSCKDANDEGYQSVSPASSLGDLSPISTSDKKRTIVGPMASSPLPESQTLAGESLAAPNPSSSLSPKISPIRKAPAAPAKSSFAAALAQKAEAVNNRPKLPVKSSILRKPALANNGPVVVQSVARPVEVVSGSGAPLPPPPPPMPSCASGGKLASKGATPTKVPSPGLIPSRQVDAHAALMEQIKNKGAVTLRPAKHKELPEKAQDPKSALMAQIRNSGTATLKRVKDRKMAQKQGDSKNDVNASLNKAMEKIRVAVSGQEDRSTSSSDSDSEWEE